MSITEIEQAIAELSPEDLVKFHQWFEEYFAQVWDKQIEENTKSGRLDKLIAEANDEYEAGLSKPL
jgi:hypothetical protein